MNPNIPLFKYDWNWYETETEAEGQGQWYSLASEEQPEAGENRGTGNYAFKWDNLFVAVVSSSRVGAVLLFSVRLCICNIPFL